MTLIITRDVDDSLSLVNYSKNLEVDYFLFPCIEFKAPEDNYESLDKAIRSNHLYDWVFFFSKRAAEGFFSRLLELGGHFFHLSPNLKIGVIGPSTKEFIEREVGFPVDFMPSKYNSDDFLKEFQEKILNQGQEIEIRIVLPRTDAVQDEFSKRLMENSDVLIKIDEVWSYSSSIPEASSKEFIERLENLKEIIRSKQSDKSILYLSFASSLTAKNFFKLTKNINWLELSKEIKIKALSIGIKTSSSLKELAPWLDIEENQIPFKC